MNRYNPIQCTRYAARPTASSVDSQPRRLQLNTGQLVAAVENLPRSVFRALLTPSEHAMLEATRAGFLRFCEARSDFSDWRHAWAVWRKQRPMPAANGTLAGTEHTESCDIAGSPSLPEWRKRFVRRPTHSH